MAQVISLVNIKGGVGKTQCTINLAGEMSKMGRKILILDNDCQSSLTQILNISGKYTMYDLYNNPRIWFEDCVIEYNKNICVIPNTIESAMLEKELNQKKIKETILKKKYDAFNNNFDFVLIDNSPYLGITVENSLCVSSYYIEVIDNSLSALQGLKMIDTVVNNLKNYELAKDLKLLGILRNRFEKRTIFSKQFKTVTDNKLGDKLFETIIYDSVKFKEAAAMHKTIQEYNKKCAEPFKQLYYEIFNKI